ncbi:hypothetical protein [Corynebacterium sp. HMSC074C04]|uniref:hypothetical protein n=1 Tax=Corynebacterium sp. HMSC074C04 TaxID=1739514 RepID=UPI0008A96E32|nr:hypothetical protein [Corynebacterium sp. HMSC074C04]
MAQTRNKFSRKTIGIAIASAVAMGGISIPQAGAVTGIDGIGYIATAPKADEQGNPILDENGLQIPDMEYPGIEYMGGPTTGFAMPTWGGIYGGTYNNVNVIDNGKSAKTSGFGYEKTLTSKESPGHFVYDTTRTYGDAIDLADLKLGDIANHFGEDELKEKLSTPTLKTMAVMGAIAKDVHTNGTISPEVRTKFAEFGYTGDFFHNALIAINEADGDIHYYQTGAANEEEMAKRYINGGGGTQRTSADFLLDVMAGYLSQNTLGTSNDGDLTFNDLMNRLAQGNPWSDNEYLGEETNDVLAAILNMAAALPESTFRKPGNFLVHPVKWDSLDDDFKDHGFFSPLIDINNPNMPKVEDLHRTKDIYVDSVKRLDNGNIEVTRNDGEKWVIDLSDLSKAKKDIEGLAAKDEATQKELDKIKEEITKLENSTIKEVVKNGDGTYTLIRVDGTKVPGNIDTTDGSVTDVKTDGKGNLIVTIDGKDKTVPLKQVKVVEENAGTPNHTVTITTPDGKSVTFNVFDTYVTDIKWNEEKGLYEIYRSDVDGGKTVWKTIDLSDLRNRIDALEKKDSPSRDEYNTLVKEVRENRELIEKLKEQIKNQNAADQEKITSILEKITQIEKQLTDMQADLDDIKARLTKVEGRTDDITKCVAGAGMAGIPALLSIPLMVMTQLNIPGIKDLNTQIQKQIGIYNPELARQWERNGGVLQAGAVLAGLAGMIGGIAYLAKQCDPMMQSDAAKETDLGKLSSKLEKKDLGSSKKDTGATRPSEQPGEQDAPAADAPADADAEAPAEGAVEGAAEAAEQVTAPSEDLVAAQ